MEFIVSREEMAAVNEFTPIPDGTYPAQLISQDGPRDNKNGTGKILEFQFQIIGDGPYKGRKLKAFYNVINQNPEAEKIAYDNIRRCAKACGCLDLKNTEEITGKCCGIKVEVRTTSAGSQTNDIKGYTKLDGTYSVAPVASPVQEPVAKKQWYEK